MTDDWAWRDGKDRSEEDIQLQIEERSRIEVSFLRFLKWVRLIIPPTLGKPGKVITLEQWPHVMMMVAALLSYRHISVMKARQIGLSTIIAAYVLWLILFHKGAVVLLFSRAEDQSIELLRKSRSMYTQLPPFMRLELSPDSRDELGVPVMGTQVLALSSKPDAGISFSPSLIVFDEHAFHEFDSALYSSAMPATEQVGGQAVSLSTPSPFNSDCLHTRLFVGAMTGECMDCDELFTWETYPLHEGHNIKRQNDYLPLFFGWDVIPGRDEAWYERVRGAIPSEELKGLSRELYMAKNFPNTIGEALSSATTVEVFDRSALNYMKDQCRIPINFKQTEDKTRWGDLDCDICHIYKDYHVGNFYIAASDISEGVGGDYSVTGIMDVRALEIVADIMSKRLSEPDFAYHTVKLLERYHSPLWWPEANLKGRTVIEKALEMGYRRIGKRDKGKEVGKPGQRYGHWTSDDSRVDMFGTLLPAINDNQVTIFNREGLEQFYHVVSNVNRGGRIEAQSGKHDDYVMMTAILLRHMGEVKVTSNLGKPLETLSFRR